MIDVRIFANDRLISPMPPFIAAYLLPDTVLRLSYTQLALYGGLFTSIISTLSYLLFRYRERRDRAPGWVENFLLASPHSIYGLFFYFECRIFYFISFVQ